MCQELQPISYMSIRVMSTCDDLLPPFMAPLYHYEDHDPLTWSPVLWPTITDFVKLGFRHLSEDFKS
jgi:hypothetical protein